MDKLKPCPFCWGEAELKPSTIYGSPIVFVRCATCFVRTDYVWIDHPRMKATGLDESTRYTEEQAEAKVIEAWNRRKIDGLLEDVQQWLDKRPTVDAVEVVHGYNEGDVCFYGFHDENKSLALVEIVKILNDERGVAEVRFLKVFVDDTGNGMFEYLLRSGNRMNVSIKYLRNITPNFGAKMDGGTGR